LSKNLLGPISRGLLFVISAPAGTGKTTLVNMLTQEFSCIVRSVTCTTRQPRQGEKNGHDYFFLTEEEFQKKLEAGDFLEHATVFGFNYGTSRTLVEKSLIQGKHVILVIDTQGALQIKSKVDAIFIFILPPSLDELKKRLVDRGTESAEMIQKRLQWANHELEMISHYDYHVINDDLSVAYKTLKNILIAEEDRSRSV
jgi:guanylate kinase